MTELNVIGKAIRNVWLGSEYASAKQAFTYSKLTIITLQKCAKNVCNMFKNNNKGTRVTSTTLVWNKSSESVPILLLLMTWSNVSFVLVSSVLITSNRVFSTM